MQRLSTNNIANYYCNACRQNTTRNTMSICISLGSCHAVVTKSDKNTRKNKTVSDAESLPIKNTIKNTTLLMPIKTE